MLPIYRRLGRSTIACSDGRIYKGPTRPDTTDTQKKVGSAMHALMGVILPLYEEKKKRARARTPEFYVMDYGAGKHARHANFLRDIEGFKVFAFDKFKSTGGSGWEAGSIISTLPRHKRFDFVFSAYMLNVVTEDVQNDDILPEMESMGSRVAHIVRDDLKVEFGKWLPDPEHITTQWFLNVFASPAEIEEWEETRGYISDETMENFLCYGFETTRGFQRKVDLSHMGYVENRGLSRPRKWKTWTKGI